MEQVRRIQPRVEYSDLIGSLQCDASPPEGPTAADLDWYAAQAGAGSGPHTQCGELREPVAGIMSFPEWVANQAAYLRSLGSDAGDWLASKVDELADRAAFVRARSPREYEHRSEVLGARPEAREALRKVRESARLLAIGHWPETAAELTLCADVIERALRP